MTVTLGGKPVDCAPTQPTAVPGEHSLGARVCLILQPPRAPGCTVAVPRPSWMSPESEWHRLPTPGHPCPGTGRTLPSLGLGFPSALKSGMGLRPDVLPAALQWARPDPEQTSLGVLPRAGPSGSERCGIWLQGWGPRPHPAPVPSGQQHLCVNKPAWPSRDTGTIACVCLPALPRAQSSGRPEAPGKQGEHSRED